MLSIHLRNIGTLIAFLSILLSHYASSRSAIADERTPDERNQSRAETNSPAKTNSRAEPDKQVQWVEMYNGKDLAGWRVVPNQSTDAWQSIDGLIVGRGGKERSYLIFKMENVADFEMKLSYRFRGKGNSGVSIRARNDETKTRGFQSYHADFGHVGIGKNVLGAWDFHTPGRKEHRCFRGDRLVIDKDDNARIEPLRDALTAADVNKQDWNMVHIFAQENSFKYSINGKPASEFTEHLQEEKRLRSGMIQLQLHDPGMLVEFKDLKLRLLN